jgi:hypothetical protein
VEQPDSAGHFPRAAVQKPPPNDHLSPLGTGVNTDVDMSWPEVSEAELLAVLATLDYRRDAWGNAILYLEKPSGRRFAFELSEGHRPIEQRRTRYFLHPGLKG